MLNALIHMKLKAIAVISIIVVISVFANPAIVPSTQGQEMGDVKALILIADYFGWNYYDVKELLESWGINVTTISNSLDTDVPSCLNKPPRGTTADLLLSQVENDVVKQFDILFIPAGGQWHSLIQSTRVRDFIAYAHDNNIIIAAICIGNMVLANANDIVSGSSVVSYPTSNSQMTSAGAITRSGYRTVIDNCFVTGGTGGGPVGGGNEVAPTEEVCIAAVREALGYSFTGQTSISPQTGVAGTNFTIAAEVNDLDNEPVSISSGNQNISVVTARIYSQNNRSLVDVVELSDDDSNGVYSGEYTANASGLYVIDIEVEDTNGTLEVEKELLSFSINVGFTIDIVTLTFLAAGALIAIVVIIVLKRT
jgi:putative intracellular protease/amidase